MDRRCGPRAIEPVRIIRGEVIRDVRPGRARNILIGLQVSASALLLIASGVFLRSAFASATVDPGMRTSDTVIVQIVNEPMRAAMVQAVTTDPLVTAGERGVAGLDGAAARRARRERNGRKSTTTYELVSPEYFGVLDIAVVQGPRLHAGRTERSAVPASRWFPKRTARSCGRTPRRWDRSCISTPDPNAPRRHVDEPVLESHERSP